MKQVFSAIVVLLMLVGAGAVIVVNNPQHDAGLGSVMELFGDAQRTTLKPFMMGTKITPSEEMELGKKLASYVYFGDQTHDNDFLRASEYVNRLGQILVPGIKRKDIRYQFHLINHEAVNAFALPGGQIFVFSGLLNFVESEAELAFILGHEIGHVDAKHCVELFQAEIAAEKIAGSLASNFLSRFAIRFANMVITGGYRKFQEFEADKIGLRLLARAGYELEAAERVMSRLEEKFARTPRPRKAKDPLHEIARSIRTAAGSYYHSHPPTPDRVSRLREQRFDIRRSGKKAYRGSENLKKRITRTEKEFPLEILMQ